MEVETGDVDVRERECIVDDGQCLADAVDQICPQPRSVIIIEQLPQALVAERPDHQQFVTCCVTRVEREADCLRMTR